jgi:plasmid stability protein
MNITLSADEKLVEKARAYAAAHGTSLNQLIRDYLERLVGDANADKAAAEIAAVAHERPGNSGGDLPLRREDIYRERMRSF